MKKIRQWMLVMVLVISGTLCGCTASDDTTDYAQSESWVYEEAENMDKEADVFFICPTVYGGDEQTFNMSISDETSKASFLGATNMEIGIYDEVCRVFAPYYRQAALNVYAMSDQEREPYLALAYEDVKSAFEYYLENYNEGRPIVLAGFSQGADMCIRLLKDCFEDENTNELLVACYAIGWRITQEELDEYSYLAFAQTENDTGVIISFNSEAENISDSLMIPAGTKTLAINPLSWKTDGSLAEASLNLGACFTDYEGQITTEIAGLTGAYIDEARGALKVIDVSSEDYPPVLSIFEEGVYHLYDYQFFYRNLQENVQVRIDAYLKQEGNEE